MFVFKNDRSLSLSIPLCLSRLVYLYYAPAVNRTNALSKSCTHRDHGIHIGIECLAVLILLSLDVL